ncbi:MAG: prolyl oligopeptidase family serine peptidase [Oscillospiraceae bacterium]|nr:prolyl oligopeptidase family serine peptidase [Oscillospiraceae bacterium]
MKKVCSMLLLLALVLSLFSACGKTPAPVETEVEAFVTNTLISGGSSEYVIVHDSDFAAQDFARALSIWLSRAYGVQLAVEAAGETVHPYEIVVGNCRDIAGRTAEKLTEPFDFALKVAENALVLCAVNQLSYDYFGEYLQREVFVPTEEKTLTLDSEDNFFFTKSELMAYTYVDYLALEGKPFALEKVFDWKTYENADTSLPYRIYIPFNYDPQKQYPLVVNLHGAGLRGADNAKHLKFIDVPMSMPEVNLDDAIIICPQCPENQKWVDSNWGMGSYSLANVPESNEMKAVVELVCQLQENYSVDAGRIYACGFSMGGYGTWNLLMNHPDLFCAGVPMCGAGDPGMAETLKNIPVWAVHGAKDPTVPVSGSRDMATALENVGGTLWHYTELPDNEHDVWNYTYGNAEIFAWLMAQRKES